MSVGRGIGGIKKGGSAGGDEFGGDVFYEHVGAEDLVYGAEAMIADDDDAGAVFETGTLDGFEQIADGAIH